MAKQLAFLALLLLIILPSQLLAAPYFGETFTYQQPSGETFQARLYGDEFFAYQETIDGYLIIRDPNNGFFCYAKVTADGSGFISTGVRVGQAKPAGLAPKQRLASGMAMQKSLGNRNLLGVDEKGQSNKGKKLVPGKGRKILNIPESEPSPQPAPSDVTTSELEAPPQPAQGDETTSGSEPPPQPAPPSSTTLNNRVGLVLLASFPDLPGDVTKTVADIDNYCNAEVYTEFNNATSVYGYFKIQSNGKLSYKNNVTAWFTAANPRSYYTDNTAGYGSRARELIKEGLAVLAAQGFDFTQCDANNDGRLDGVNCFYAGARVNSWSEGLWPHQSSTSWTGLSGSGLSTNYFDYQITDMPSNLTIGTFCHENGHMICDFPDLYSYDGNAANLGAYSLMANSGSTHPRHVDPYLKIHAGWADVVDITSTSHQLCAVQQDRNFFYRYRNPARSQEYFLFEVRGNAGYEGPWGGAGSTNPANGLVVYHALETGTNTRSTIITADTTTNYATPYELMVVESNPSTAVIPWYDDPTPGSNDAYTSTGVNSISDSTSPALKFWATDGRTVASGANVHTISATGATMTFVIGAGALPASPATAVTATQLEPFVDTGKDAADHAFSVFNGGGGTLSYAVSDNAAWLACAPANGSATTEADVITVSYTTAALAPGNYTATITIDGGSAGIKTIGVSLIVNQQPTLVVTPSSLSVVGTQGLAGPTDSLGISNSGGGTGSYSLSASDSWMILDRTTGDVANEVDLITVDFDATTLSSGIYNGTITVTSPNATNSLISIPVQFTVQSTDMIVTYPNGGEAFDAATTKTITWASSLGGTVKIDLLKGGTIDRNIVDGAPNNGSFLWTIPADMGGGDYGIQITSMEVPSKTDTSNANFTIFPTGGTTFSFETDLDGWIQETTDNINWTRQSNSTPSSNTGPSGASDGSFYLFTEASGNFNKTAIIYQDFDFSSLYKPLLTFDYHMYGVSMGTLNLEVSTDGGASWDSPPAWSLAGDQGNTWTRVLVDLSTYGSLANVRLRFRGVTGSNFESDMAIDRVLLREGLSSSVRFASSTYTVDENDGTATITVERTGSTTGAVSVDYATSNNTATAGSDYNAVTGTLSWVDGEGGSKTFNVTILDNSILEPLFETVDLTLSNVAGTIITGSNPATLSIRDNDNTPPLVNAGSDQTLFLTGTTPQLGWSYSAWTGDANSAISDQYTYTAAHCFGDNHASVTVNNVTFTSNFNTSGTGWSVGGGISNWQGNDDAAVTGTSENLAQEFIYNGSPRTVTFSGLTEGQAYEVIFYSAGWDPVDARVQTFSGTSETSLALNQNFYGNNNGIKISCIYVATGTSQVFTITPTSGTFHLYAMLNREINVASATANLDGTVSDADGHTLVTTWSTVSGPAGVTIGNVNAVDTTATFTAEGIYTLRLTSADGYTQTTDDVVITVNPAGAGYSVTYAGNDSTGGSVPIDTNNPYIDGATVTVLGNTGSLVRAGYTFNNWNTAANGSGTNYAAASTFSISSNTTLYAQWNPNNYTVTFNKQSGSGGSNSVTATSGSAMPTATAPSLAGYTFGGYFTQASGGGTQYYTAAMVSSRNWDISSDVTLYAFWLPNAYTVTFNANGGGTPSPTSKSVTYNSNYGNLATVSRPGYTLTGWFTAASSGSKVTDSTTVTTVSDHSLYAQWAANTYAITYNGNGNTSGTAPSSVYKTHDINIILTTNSGNLAKTNYVFSGWNTEANGSGTDYAEGTIYTTNAPLILHAKWIQSGMLAVNSGDLTTSGYFGGPFSPTSKQYTLQNTGDIALDWTVGKTASWVSLTAPTSGTLAAGASTLVTVSINAAAEALVTNTYDDTVTFTNISNGLGTTTRGVNLTVNDIPVDVALGALAQTYDGNPKSVTVTTVPTPVATTTTYNGESNAPVGAGSYAVLSTVTEPNHTGSANGTLVISKASQTISFDPLAGATFGDAPITLSATSSSNLPVSYTSSNPAVATVSGATLTIVGVGSTTITASQTGDSNYLVALNVNQTFTVSPSSAGTLFADNFENPAVLLYSEGNSPSNWIKASNGFGASRHGLNHKASGDFSAPTGNNQAYAFRYTNSGLTTAVGKIGSPTAGITYTISFDVAMDGGSLPYNVQFIAFDDLAVRNDMKPTSGANILATASGNANADGTWKTVSFSYTATANAATDLAVRLVGATTSAVIDNVQVVANAGYWDINGSTAGSGGIDGDKPSGIWNVANSNWNNNFAGTGTDITSWNPGLTAAFAAGSNATGAYTVTVDGIHNIRGLNFEEGSTTLLAGASPALRMVANSQAFVATNLNVRIEAPITEDTTPRQFGKSGQGNLILAGDNTAATGGISVFDGAITFDSASSINGGAHNILSRNVAINTGGAVAFGASFGSAVDVQAALNNRIATSSTGVIAADGQTTSALDFATAGLSSAFLGAVGEVTYTGAFTPHGTTYRLGGGTGTLTMGSTNGINGSGYTAIISGDVTLAAANNYTGGTTLNRGVLTIDHSGALGSGALTISGPVFLSSNGSVTFTNTVSANTDFGVVGTGSLGIGPLTLSANRGIYLFTTSGVTNFASITGSNRSLSFHGNGDATVTGNITTGSGTLTKQGNGNITLSGSNSYTGVTTVASGTLVAGANVPATNTSNGAFGKASSEIVLGAAGSNLNASILTNGSLTIGRAIRIPAANNTDSGNRVLTLGGSTAHSSVFSGNIFLGTNSQAGRGVTLTAASNGQVTFSGVIQDPSTMDATNYTVTKSGPGTVIYSNTNTYTGSTTISAGRLLINGGTAGGAMTVRAGATLGGTGIVGGNTTIEDAGRLEFDITTPAASHDSLDLASGRTLTFSASSVLTINSSGGGAPGIYTLITGGNNIMGVAPATLNLPSDWVASVAISGNSLLLNVTSTTGGAPGSLAVTPAQGLTSSGYVGGPFSSDSVVYTLSNPGTSSIDWTASNNESWVNLSAIGGTLAAGTNVNITVSIGSGATSLTVGDYNDTVTFSNITNATGDTTRSVALTVNALPTYSVSYEGNGNTDGTTPASQTKTKDVDLTLSSPGTLILTGYTFAGWNTAANGSGTNFAAGATYTENASVTLYAQWTINTYTLTYTAGTGGTLSGQSIQTVDHNTDGTAVTAVPNTGYHFVKWSDDLITSSRTDTNVTADLTVTATFALNTYTVSYNANSATSGSVPADQEKTYGTDLTLAANSGNLTRTGYTFAGWNTSANGTGTNFTQADTYTANADVTLYATWTANTYTITFDPNGGDIPSPANKLVTYDSTYEALATTTRTGYTFNGWFTAATGGTQVTSATTVAITADQTLYAQWSINTYTLTYAAGTGGTLTGQSIQTVDHNTDGTAVTAVPNTGYHFVKWSDDLITSSRTETNVTADLTVTATFALNTYAVSYNANSATSGSVPADQTKTYGTDLTLAANSGNLTRTGYTFAGWNTSTNGTGTNFTQADTYTANADVTLYATWTANTYTITFDANGGDIPSPANKLVTYDSTYEALATTTRTGYTFNGWFTAATGGTQVTSATTVAITADQTLYAQWTINTYTLTYTAGTGGTLTGQSIQTVDHNTNGTAVTAVPNTGYHFVKWSDDLITSSRTDTNVTADLTVTATFALNTYTVSYNANSATSGSVPVDQEKTYGTDLTLAANSGNLTRTGYTFAGWNTSANGTGTNFTQEDTYTANADVTLYATWTAKAIPTINTWPTATSIEKGQSLSNAILEGGGASVAGNFIYDNPSFTPSAGTYSAAITFVPTDIENYSTVSGNVDVTVLTEFEAWTDGETTFSGDSNEDGTPDGLAWLLGATSPVQNAYPMLPVTEHSEGNMVIGFKCLKASERGSAVLNLQYSADLGHNDPWSDHTVPIPETSGTVDGVEFVITIIEGSDLILVQATVPMSGDGLFVRLEGSIPAP